MHWNGEWLLDYWRYRQLMRCPNRIGLESIGSVRDQLCWCHRWWLLYTPRTNGRVWGDGRRGFWWRCCSGAKWGDRDNDNVRSALAGGLLRLMDALIISKQELQWFAYIKLMRTIIVRFRLEFTREEKMKKTSQRIQGKYKQFLYFNFYIRNV